MTSKLIIRNEVENLSDWWALFAVQQVVNLGKISTTSKGPQYCFATKVEVQGHGKIVVYAYKNFHSEGFILRSETDRPTMPVNGLEG